MQDEHGAYREVVERQASRSLRPLSDHAEGVERNLADRERREDLAHAFGEWMAQSLGPWDWFVNPISFRDRHPDLERNPKTGKPRRYRVVGYLGEIAVCAPDPRLKSWEPHSRNRIEPGPPDTFKALAEIYDWLFELQAAAERPIRAVIAEEFGRIGGRYHAHLLIAGVSHLRRSEWWQKAFERFGITRIESFDPERGAAFYAAKYAAKAFGALHFIGPLPDGLLTADVSAGPETGGRDVACSPALPHAAFRSSFENIFGSRWNRGKR